MLRLPDFRCPTHGIFEVLMDIDMKAPDYREKLREHACPVCGAASVGVYTKAPSMQPNSGEHAVEFGGRTFRRDDVEEFLDAPPTQEPSAEETERKREKLLDRFSRVAYQEMHGTLAPAPELAPEQSKIVESSLANVSVDPEKLTAHSEHLTDAMRNMEFKE